MELMGSAGLGFVCLSGLSVRRGRLGSVGSWSRERRLENFSVVLLLLPPPSLVVLFSEPPSLHSIDYRQNLTLRRQIERQETTSGTALSSVRVISISNSKNLYCFALENTQKQKCIQKNDGLEPMTCAPTERQSFHADADAYDDANDLGSFFSPFLHSLACTHRGLQPINEEIGHLS
jgi:hypothetical protein